MVLNKSAAFLTLCLWLAAAFYPAVSFAHKVMIFGWVDGERVNTISKFSGGKKVKNAPVSVYNAEGALILKGTTDSGGEFSFERPGEKGGLKVVLEASMGHKTSCLIDLQPEETAVKQEADLVPRKEAATGQSVDVKNLEMIIEKALDKKMALILRLVAEKEEKQSVSEIVSGIGYILGLVGIALWVRNR